MNVVSTRTWWLSEYDVWRDCCDDARVYLVAHGVAPGKWDGIKKLALDTPSRIMKVGDVKSVSCGMGADKHM